ncbi:hypothetical protein KSP39_PZI012720 [Platanthera zijinensis]|uniref:Uncharacterized protein n=1 Tax=Platanthera zijinensis TaxID=2320716 RepID=A0AAP0BGG1_9ASPA
MVEDSESTLALEETTAMETKDRRLQDRNTCIHKKNGSKQLKKWKRKIYNKDDGGTGKYRLVSYDELPEYMKENEFLRKYYRSEWPLSHAFLSLFSWHNETINVWTCLASSAIFSLGEWSKFLKQAQPIVSILTDEGSVWHGGGGHTRMY